MYNLFVVDSPKGTAFEPRSNPELSPFAITGGEPFTSIGDAVEAVQEFVRQFKERSEMPVQVLPSKNSWTLYCNGKEVCCIYLVRKDRVKAIREALAEVEFALKEG